MFSVSQCPWLFKASCKTFVRLCCRYNIFSVGTGDWDCHQNIARQVAVSGHTTVKRYACTNSRPQPLWDTKLNSLTGRYNCNIHICGNTGCAIRGLKFHCRSWCFSVLDQCLQTTAAAGPKSVLQNKAGLPGWCALLFNAPHGFCHLR